MLGAHDVDEGLGRQDGVEPLPLLGQESLVALVGLPVLEVGVLMGDVEVAHEKDMTPLGRALLASGRQVLTEPGKEGHLAVLLGYGLLVLGVRSGSLGQVQAGDGDGCVGEINLDVAPLVSEGKQLSW